MAERTRIGTNPLNSLIKDTREVKSKPDNISKSEIQSKQSKHKNTSNMSEAKTVKQGLPEEWTRATFIVREQYLEKLKAKAYWDRKAIKEVLDEALSQYLGNKKIKPIKRE